MQITYTQTDRGFVIFANGYKLGPTFTLETGEANVKRLINTLEPYADELEKLARAKDEKRQWNINNFPNGKNWPEFKMFDRRFNALQRVAGIADS